jgi:hypothetical protein
LRRNPSALASVTFMPFQSTMCSAPLMALSVCFKPSNEVGPTRSIGAGGGS